MRRRKVILILLVVIVLLAAGIKAQASANLSIESQGELLVQNKMDLKTAVWGLREGQNDLKWYDCTLTREGYQAEIDLESHGEQGTFICDTYAFIAGEPIFLNREEVYYDLYPTFLVHKNAIDVQIVAYGYPYHLVAAVWSQKNGQDDLEWYWLRDTPVLISDKHMDGSLITIDLYGYDIDGNIHFLERNHA